MGRKMQQVQLVIIDAIDTFMDTRHCLDISHNAFWLDPEGQTLKQISKITLDDIQVLKSRPKIPDAIEKIIAYFNKLKIQDIHAIHTWPVHCQIGTWGHNIHPDIMQACIPR